MLPTKPCTSLNPLWICVKILRNVHDQMVRTLGKDKLNIALIICSKEHPYSRLTPFTALTNATAKLQFSRLFELWQNFRQNPPFSAYASRLIMCTHVVVVHFIFCSGFSTMGGTSCIEAEG